MLFFKKQGAVKDERIVNAENKIIRTAFFLASFIAVLSIIFKSFSGYDYRDMIPEIMIILIPWLYYWIKIVKNGIYTDSIEVHERTSRFSVRLIYIITGVLAGLAISVFFGLRSAALYGNDTNRIWYFTLVFCASLMIYLPFFCIGHIFS